MSAYKLHKFGLAATGLLGLYNFDSPAILSSNLVELDTNSNNGMLKKRNQQDEAVQRAILASKSLCGLKMIQSAIPGMVIAVSVDGKTVWKQGFGYADVENRVAATEAHVMRIASISKPLTMVAAARLFEEDKLDFDKPISEYVPSWPEKHPKITTRQLASHTSGIRHYKEEKGSEDKEHDSKYPEFFSNTHYKTVTEALDIFKEDDLICEPGTEYHYTTFGFSVLSAVIEGASGEKFPRLMKKLFKEMGLNNTYLDENEPIIPYRSKYYQRNKDAQLINVPSVDNSNKWAGGGFLSTVGDLLQLGNAMLFSYQFKADQEDSMKDVVFKPTPYSPVNNSARCRAHLKPFLKPETVKELWQPVMKCSKESDISSCLAWFVMEQKEEYAFCKKQRFFATHTGGAVGASSVLLIFPRQEEKSGPPQGIVVSIICNLQGVGLSQLALEVAKIFDDMKIHKPLKYQNC